MVLVPLIAGSHSVQKDGQPLFFIPRQDVFLRGKPQFRERPRAMRFQIIFRHQVDSQFVAETVQPRIIRIMTGSYCVDVVLLHEDKILQDHVPADLCPAAVAGSRL